MLTLPDEPETENIRALASLTRERYTGLTTAVITLVNEARDGFEIVYKNGVLLDPAGGASGYSISGKTITLGTAAIAGDVFLIFYYSRSN
jgi:hypothetical protein